MRKRIFNLILILVILLNCFIVPTVYAWDVDVNAAFSGGGSPSGKAKAGIDSGIEEAEDFSMKLISNFIVAFRVAGLGIAVIILMSLGAKFIWGSVEQKAEVKKHLMVYVTGVGVLIMASFILGIVQDFIVGNFK